MRTARLVLPAILLAAATGLGWQASKSWTQLRAPETHRPLSGTRVSEPEALPAAPEIARDPPLSQYREIVERPLFEISRRPPDPAAAAERPSPPETPSEPQAPRRPEFTVVGIVADGGRRLVLTDRREQGRAVTLGVGDTLEGWSVDSIETGHVVLSAGTRRARLGLDYSGTALFDR